MTTQLKFDHAILVVNDLKQAQADFQALGFTVFYGGKHADGHTENCLIVFNDDKYIELIGLVNQEALDDPNGMHAQLFKPGEGWAGYALLSDNLKRDVSAMQARGLTLIGPQDNNRTRPDGELVEWRAAMFADRMTPFFLEDRTPRVLRVPDDKRTQHENGTTGISRVVVAVPELDTSIEQYRKILDQTPAESTLDLPDVRAVDFSLDDTMLTLAAPTDTNTRLYHQLRQRGTSVYLMQLTTGSENKHQHYDIHNALIDVT